jgi:hypothetical protein
MARKYENLFGNKNAEKWTFIKAAKLFHAAIELTQQKDQVTITDSKGNITNIVEVYAFDFIGEIARELGTFHLIFKHLVKRFPVLERLESQLNSNIESNCYFNTKKGYIKEATGIVNLKSNWKWTDRQQTDVTSDGKQITFNLNFPDGD